MRKTKESYVGNTYITKEGYKITITNYGSSRKVTILFENGYKRVVEMVEIKRGSVRNPYHKSLFGEGWYGEGKHKTTENGKITKSCSTWNSMMRRCYHKPSLIRNPNYIGVTVCEEWKCFQTFADWFELHYNPETMSGWNLDKDIILKGNKEYSPDVCCFLPQNLNKIVIKCDVSKGSCFLGVSKSGEKFQAYARLDKSQKYLGTFLTKLEAHEAYKQAKELYIKQSTEEYEGQLDPRAYKALINYKIEITD